MIYTFVKCYVDGGVLGGNPSRTGVYWSAVLELPGQTVTLRKKSNRFFTNGDSEWLALHEALQYLVDHKVVQPVIIYSDSSFVIDTYNGKKNLHNERHMRLYHQCHRLAEQLSFVGLRFPPRPDRKPRGWPASRRFPEDWRPRDVIVQKVGH